MNSSTASPGFRFRRLVVMLLVLLTLVTALLVAVVIAVRSAQLPRVTDERLAAATAKWAAHAPANYDLRIELTGLQTGMVRVTVRGGEVTEMKLNGRVTKSHLWDEWSVPGLLNIIRRDLEACANPAAKNFQDILPRGTFDEKLGYPTEYRRLLPGGQEAAWKIIECRPAINQNPLNAN